MSARSLPSRLVALTVALGAASLLAVAPAPAEPLPAWMPPTGRPRLDEQSRPADAVLLGCSPRRPVCVHLRVPSSAPQKARPQARSQTSAAASGPRSATEELRWLERSLAAAESALDGFAALGLPLPPNDAPAGGSGAFDLVLDPSVVAGAAVVDPPDLLAWSDRRSSFGLMAPPGASPGCGPELEVARVLAEALLLGLDSSVGDGVLAMQSSYLATLVSPCSSAEDDAVDRAQREPDRALASFPRGRLAGSLLLPWYLDDHYRSRGAGGVMTALIALGAQRADPKATLLQDEPDAFDALRRATGDRDQSLDDLLLDFAVTRAFAGARSDGAHLSGTESWGDFARPRFEWSVPFASLPRRLGPSRQLEPTGATYLWVDTPEPSVGGLLVQATWEPWQVLRWALVKVDAEGREVGRLADTGVYGHSTVQLAVEDLRGLAGVLIVGTYVGNDDRARPYDPDEPVAELADYELRLHRSADL
jgi:hypothetical protein